MQDIVCLSSRIIIIYEFYCTMMLSNLMIPKSEILSVLESDGRTWCLFGCANIMARFSDMICILHPLQSTWTHLVLLYFEAVSFGLFIGCPCAMGSPIILDTISPIRLIRRQYIFMCICLLEVAQIPQIGSDPAINSRPTLRCSQDQSTNFAGVLHPDPFTAVASCWEAYLSILDTHHSW